ncbi:MAG: cobalamin-binding protein [Chloroflexi bacterium]|nr:cobalamin-binding protein [Chloroflexota bacterium]
MKQHPGMPFSLLLLLVIVPALILGSACSQSTQSGEETSGAGAFSITDDLGKTFNFDGPVSTIVSLAPSNTEIVFALGAGDKLIGRTDFCDFPPEAASVESVGSYSTPNKERIVVLNPDIVLATSVHNDSGDTAWLESMGLRVITLDPHTLNDVMGNLILVGKLAGRKTQAEQLVVDLRTRIDAVATRTAELTAAQKPRVLHVTWHNPLWTAGKGTFIDEMIQMAGGTNVFGDTSGDCQVNMDTAVAANPQVITVFSNHGAAGDASYDYLVAGDSPFRTTDAYLNHRTYVIDSDLASRGGPRIVDALELYAKAIHPEMFG